MSPCEPVSQEDVTWDISVTLESSRRTPILTCLKSREEKVPIVRLAVKAQECLENNNYRELLSLLDCDDPVLVHKTDMIEKVILTILYDLHLENPRKHDFNNAIKPYEDEIIKIIESLARAKSLDIIIDKSLANKHARLVDYVSRVHLSREAVSPNPLFWKWLAENHSNIDKFLRLNDEKRTKRENSFVQTLGVLFSSDDASKEYTKYLDNVCKKVMDVCHAEDLESYTNKIYNNYKSTIAEMKMLAILYDEFNNVRVEPTIPPGGKNTDLRVAPTIPPDGKNTDLLVEVENQPYFVEVYSSRSYTAVGSQSKFRVKPSDEWENLFGKKQVSELKKANVRTILVLDVGHEYLPDIETATPQFGIHICNAMPQHSEIVIIRGARNVEIMSLRDGRVVETSDLGKVLESAMQRGWQ